MLNIIIFQSIVWWLAINIDPLWRYEKFLEIQQVAFHVEKLARNFCLQILPTHSISAIFPSQCIFRKKSFPIRVFIKRLHFQNIKTFHTPIYVRFENHFLLEYFKITKYWKPWVFPVLTTTPCSRSFQKVKIRLHSVRILRFYCYSDFEWNQILGNWLRSKTSFLAILEVLKFVQFFEIQIC